MLWWKKLQYIGLLVLTVTQCSINVGRRFSEVELKVLLTHVSNVGYIFCYIHSYSVVIYMFTWDDPLLYGLYIGVPSVCFRDTWSPRVKASYDRAADSPTECSSEYNVQKTVTTSYLALLVNDPLLEFMYVTLLDQSKLEMLYCRVLEFFI